jgi:hypothetical protein
MQSDSYTELMYQALGSAIGIVVSTTDFERAVQKFYSARKKCADPDLDVLQFRRSPYTPETEIWIVKAGKGADNAGQGI